MMAIFVGAIRHHYQVSKYKFKLITDYCNIFVSFGSYYIYFGLDDNNIKINIMKQIFTIQFLCITYIFIIVWKLSFMISEPYLHLSLSQNQQMRKIINKYKMYLQPLPMYRQINCHRNEVFIKELQVLVVL
jgi:hypothetical protein